MRRVKYFSRQKNCQSKTNVFFGGKKNLYPRGQPLLQRGPAAINFFLQLVVAQKLASQNAERWRYCKFCSALSPHYWRDMEE